MTDWLGAAGTTDLCPSGVAHNACRDALQSLVYRKVCCWPLWNAGITRYVQVLVENLYVRAGVHACACVHTYACEPACVPKCTC